MCNLSCSAAPPTRRTVDKIVLERATGVGEESKATRGGGLPAHR